MGAPHQRKVNPVVMAEQVLELLDKIPGARTVFLERTRNESIHLRTAKVNDPEPDKWRKSKGFVEVGTYKRGAAHTDVVGDLLETMGRVR
jgi:hypothetical protein